MGRRQRRSSSWSDDDSSSSDSSRSRYSKGSGSSGRSTQTAVSRAPVKDDHLAVRILKYAVGAPKGPVAVKKVTYQEPVEYTEMEFVHGQYREVTRLAYREYYRFYWESVYFDDSISEIAAGRSRQGSRMSKSSKYSKRGKSHGHSRHEHLPQEAFDEQYESESESDYMSGGPHPGDFPPMPHMHPHPPPPPPPPGNGPPAGFIKIETGQGGGFREGWD